MDKAHSSERYPYEAANAHSGLIQQPGCKTERLQLHRFDTLKWRRANYIINGTEKRRRAVHAVRQMKLVLTEVIVKFSLFGIHWTFVR